MSVRIVRDESKVTDLEAIAGDRYKVEDDGTHDPDRSQRKWTRQIFGKQGIIYPQGYDGSLAVCAYPVRLGAKLSKLGLERISGIPGGEETVYKFYPKDLDKIAGLIQAKRRRRISPEQRANMLQRLRRLPIPEASRLSKPVSVPEEGPFRGQISTIDPKDG